MKKSNLERFEIDGKKFLRSRCTVCNEKITYRFKSKPSRCPNCDSLYWDKPADERNLFLVQERYISEGRPPEILEEMYLLVQKYSENIIKHRVKNSYRMRPDLMEEKVSDLTNLFIEKYLRDPEMKIESSFGGFLLRLSLGVLYGKRREEEHESLNTKIDNTIEIEERLESIGFKNLTHQESSSGEDSNYFNRDTSVYSEVFKIINKIHGTIQETDPIPSSSVLYLIGLRNRLLKKTQPFMDRYYNTIAGNKIKEDIQKTELVIYNYLKERSYVK